MMGKHASWMKALEPFGMLIGVSSDRNRGLVEAGSVW